MNHIVTAKMHLTPRELLRSRLNAWQEKSKPVKLDDKLHKREDN